MQDSVWNHHVVVLLALLLMLVANGAENGTRELGLGVILDIDSVVGKSIRISILMALEDLYGAHQNNNSTIVIHPHFRDSKNDSVQAASAAIDLLKNTQVMAILGPQQSSQADFVIDIAERSKVLMISPATSPNLCPNQNPYFIRAACSSSTQAQPIAALVKSFGWREVVFVYEDNDFGRGLIPYLLDAMANINTQVKYRTLLSPYSTDDWILQQLYKLKTMQTRVFVVHMLPNLASRFFKQADEAGMMAPGFAWIITDVLTSLLHHLDPHEIDSMQGVIGVKPYIPPSNQLTNFERRWKRRFRKDYPYMERVELDMFGLWSYDSIFALATALRRVEAKLKTTFKRPKKASIDLDAIGTSEMGSTLLPKIRNIRIKGLSGDFHVVNGELQVLAYQIVNVIGKGEKQIGFWNSNNGIAARLSHHQRFNYTSNKGNLGAIIWPGDAQEIPKGWEIPTGGDKKFKVGIPTKGGFVEFVKADKDPITNEVTVTGFCIDVFKAVIDKLPFAVPIEFIPFESGDYNDLVYQIFLERFDMVVGDVTILRNRSNYVDFTFPYSESGVSMVVPVKADDTKSAWIFMRPLETGLWITIGAFFMYTGFVVWVLEHRVNQEFRGPPRQQLGMIFWFSFSTLVFAHKEKMTSNLSRFVVIVWIFVVLVLTSSYTASLTSMLTVQKLKPTVTNIAELIQRGDFVGYQNGSFIADMLKEMGFEDDKLIKYTNIQEYENALSNEGRNKGVSAIVDEVPYLRLLHASYCSKYIMVGPTHKTAGFGFAFPKGSPLVAEFSRAILKVIEEQMTDISNKWFGNETDCAKKNDDVEPFDKLTLDSFKGLFLIAGLSSTGVLVIFLFMFFYENKEILVSDGSFRQKLNALIQSFDHKKDKQPSIKIETKDSSRVCVEEHLIDNSRPSQATSIDDQDGMFSHGSSPNDKY